MRLFKDNKLLRPSATALTTLALFIALAGVSKITNPTNRIETPNDENLLRVNLLKVHSKPGYRVKREFIGRVEAQRESRIGFELDGMVKSVLVDDGDTVEQGQILAELDTELLKARRSELVAIRNQARATLKLAEGTRKRVREANDLNAVSSQQWDEAERNYTAKKAAFEQARSALFQVDVRIEKSRLRAPYAALIAERFLDEGQVISAGTAVLGLLENSQPEARIGIAGPAVDSIKPDNDYQVLIRGRAIPATVRAVLPIRNPGTRSVDVILTLQAKFDGIRSGDLARLQIDRQVNQPGFWVPLTALTESSRGLWAVYAVDQVVDHIGTLHRRELELLYQQSDQAFVRGGLLDGEQIVSAGLHRLVPRQRVQIATVEIAQLTKR